MNDPKDHPKPEPKLDLSEPRWAEVAAHAAICEPPVHYHRCQWEKDTDLILCPEGARLFELAQVPVGVH